MFYRKICPSLEIYTYTSVILELMFAVAMSILEIKIVMLAMMGIFALLFGLLPIKIYKCIKLQQTIKSSKEELATRLLSILSCFSGGVLLGVCLLDLLPTANDLYLRPRSFTLRCEFKRMQPLQKYVKF
ncbi:unnamed protein product [Onchocerca ochengi]|uniref:Aa_trans domain-containing protein n=1 Tax=Onchocerca ochengi TaxID=42157 RepID=A0A182EI66_ONCOC|nr:unnamed protein product [Onchocerca ochengi]